MSQFQNDPTLFSACCKWQNGASNVTQHHELAAGGLWEQSCLCATKAEKQEFQERENEN